MTESHDRDLATVPRGGATLERPWEGRLARAEPGGRQADSVPVEERRRVARTEEGQHRRSAERDLTARDAALDKET